MVYLIGVIGFIGGFVVGLMVIYFLLRNVPKEELVDNASIKWTYGLLTWAIAAIGAYSMVKMYEQYFM